MARARRASGIVVAASSVLFLVWAVYRSLDGMPASFWQPGLVWLLIGLGVAYLAVNQVLGLAWFLLLRELRSGQINWSTALAIFNRTQFFKYLPGNVFHMLGRLAMANRAGMPTRTLALAQAGEIATQLTAALLIAVFFGGRMLLPLLDAYRQPLVRLIVPLAVAAGLLLLLGLFWMRDNRQVVGRVLRACLVALPVYCVFLVLSSGCALVLMYRFDPSPAIGAGELIGLFAASWLIGFVLPGAPGGLGAREALVVVGMTYLGADWPVATATALSHRIVTIAGDALAAALGWIMLRGAGEHLSPHAPEAPRGQSDVARPCDAGAVPTDHT